MHHLRRGRLAVLALLTSVALVVGFATAATAGEREHDAAAVVGGFGIGDGLEGAIDERVGAFRFAVPVGGLQLGWDSRAAGEDRHRLGAGWSWGLDRIQTRGGVQVHLASGGVFAADDTHPSGLAGYGAEDVVFEQSGGALPGRALDLPGVPQLSAPVAYAFILRELGGIATYFNAAGDPVARLDRFGARTDWAWLDPTTHRLAAVVDPHGMVTALDWSEPDAIVVRPGANLEAGAEGAGTVCRLATDGGRVVASTDASGGRVSFGYARTGSGLVSSISGVSGGITRVEWRAYPDAVPRVASVTTTDAAGAELSRRTWEPGADGALSSGWPRDADERAASGSADPGSGYRSSLGDGSTRVVSEYSGRHLLTHRSTVASSPSGQYTVHEQALAYPGDGLLDPVALPGNWSRPSEVTATLRDAAGRERTVTETFRFDARGRAIERIGPDGTLTRTEYDDTARAGSRLPIGLPTTETVIAPDGLRQITRHTLNPAGTAIVATETLQGASIGDLAATARVEVEVRDDGFVAARREVSAVDPQAGPMTTSWARSVDARRGTMTTTETVGVGTANEASTTQTTSLLHGGVLASIDALGNTARTAYDAVGRPVTATDARGRVTTVAYESAQQHGRNAVTSTGPDGVAHTEVRDALGRTIRIADNVDRGAAVPGHVRVAEIRSYPEPGVMAVTDAWGATTTTRKDLFGRVVEVTTPSGLVQVSAYDDVRNTVTTALTPTGSIDDAEFVRTETRDVHDRPTGLTGSRADGGEVPAGSTTYDGLGRVIATSDGTVDGRVERDALGRPVQEVLGDLTATRRFDGFGRSVEKTVADTASGRSGGTREHDELGRPAVETDQAGRAVAVAYTADGLVESAVATDGARTEHTYDPVTRQLLTSTTTAPGREPIRTGYAYDPAADRVTAVFDPANPAETTIASTSDAFGNVTSVVYPDGRTITHAYDAHGRRVATTDIAGNTTRLEHTPDGLLDRVEQRAAGGRLLAEVSYAYDAYRRMTTLTRGNGLVTEYTFTTASEIATETTTDASGRVQSRRTYTYDPRGDLVRRTDTVGSTTSGEREAGATTTEYVYDAHRRLIGSAERDAGADPGAIARETTYRLSAAGDVLGETTTTAPGSAAEVTVTHSFEYGPRGELTARTRTEPTSPGEPVVRQDQTWDAAGNLLRGLDGTRFEYDAANRPVAERAADGTATKLRYWADGTRRDRTTRQPDGALETTGFYWDGAGLLNDTHDASGTAAYLLGAGRHSRTILESGDATTTYYSTDRHGNVTDTTDEAGDTVRRVAYTDYGVATDTGPSRGLPRDPFGYAGEYTDPTGRQHLQARTYDPVALQFTTRDEADRHNRYAYADLNPIMNVDPTGRAAISDAWHPVWLGLSILFTAAIGVAALAGVPAAFTWGSGLAVAGVLTDAWAFMVSVGGLSVQAADRAGTPVDDGARAFFESPITHLSDFVAGAGFVAAGAFSINGLPRLARWLRARLPAQHEAELTTFPTEDMRTLIADWEEMVLAMRADPLSTLTPEYDRLLGRTVSSFQHDVLALVANRPVMVQPSLTAPPQPLLVEGRVVRGFRGWLNNEHRIPLEVSAQIYGHAGLPLGADDRHALATVLLQHVRPVHTMHRKITDVPPDLEVKVALRDWWLSVLKSRFEILTGVQRSNVSDTFG